MSGKKEEERPGIDGRERGSRGGELREEARRRLATGKRGRRLAGAGALGRRAGRRGVGERSLGVGLPCGLAAGMEACGSWVAAGRLRVCPPSGLVGWEVARLGLGPGRLPPQNLFFFCYYYFRKIK